MEGKVVGEGKRVKEERLDEENRRKGTEVEGEAAGVVKEEEK